MIFPNMKEGGIIARLYHRANSCIHDQIKSYSVWLPKDCSFGVLDRWTNSDFLRTQHRHLVSPNPSQLPHDQKIMPSEVKDSSAKTKGDRKTTNHFFVFSYKGSDGVLLFLTKLTFGQQHPPVLLVLASAPQDNTLPLRPCLMPIWPSFLLS